MELDKGLFWPIICVGGIIYLIFIELKNYKLKKNLQNKVEYIKESIVSMEVIDKLFSEGKYGLVGGNRIPSKYPDTYIIKLKYDDSYYEINDEELFNFYNIGESIKLKLITNLDKDKNMVSYEIYSIK